MAVEKSVIFGTKLSGKVVFNRGLRTFHLWPLQDAKNGNLLKARALKPDQTIECLAPVYGKDDAGKDTDTIIHDEYAWFMESFKKEVVDIDKMAKPAGDKIDALQKQNADLAAQVKDLTAKLAENKDK